MSESDATIYRSDLKPDCERCCGLCCVAPAFARSSDFAIDKAPGVACPNLTRDFRCSIHERLRPEGFSGCVAFDCFGAGQKVTQITFGGDNWRQSRKIASQMFEAFSIMLKLHSMLTYLNEALGLAAARRLHPQIRRKLDEIESLTVLTGEGLSSVDVPRHGKEVESLLVRASRLVRA